TGRIDYRLLEEAAPTGLILLVEIDAVGEPGAPAVTGVLVGDTGAFPTLYRSGQALFTTILNGGFGGRLRVHVALLWTEAEANRTVSSPARLRRALGKMLDADQTRKASP